MAPFLPYYVCSQAQKRGWHTCPSKSVPAAEIENFVLDQLRQVGPDHFQEMVDRLAPMTGNADESTETFDARWTGLSTPDKVQVVQQFVERVEFDGGAGDISIVFRSNGSDQEQEETP